MNSLFILGGLSVVVLGGVALWYISKSDNEEKVQVEDIIEEKIDTTNLIKVYH